MNYLSTTIVIHWDIILIVWAAIISLIIVLSLINILCRNQILKYINNGYLDRALKKALVYEKLLSPPLFKNENFMIIALLYLNANDYQNWLLYLSKITNPQFQGEKHFWEAIAALIENDVLAAKLHYGEFEKAQKPKSKMLRRYEYYENRLNVIFDYYEKKDEESTKRLEQIILESNKLHSSILIKLIKH